MIDDQKINNDKIKDNELKELNVMSILFIIIGIIFIILSILNSYSNIVFTLEDRKIFSFIGLGILFWGTILFLVKPKHYVDSQLLILSILPNYRLIDQILDNFDFNTNSYFIPPFPKDIVMPGYMEGLKQLLVYIPYSLGSFPTIQEISENRLVLNGGILFPSPGSGIIDNLNINYNLKFDKIPVEEICDSLPIFLVENLRLMNKVSFTRGENEISIHINESIYKSLYTDYNIKSPSILGSPVISAIAHIISISTGKIVQIKNINYDTHSNSIQATYLIRDDLP